MPLGRPGFQGSETSSVEVDIYQHGDDPVVLYSDGGLFNLQGRRKDDPSHCVIAVQTTKALGQASGQFSITLKPSSIAEEIFQWLVDDDWIDLVFYRHDQPWHVMRGLIDEIRRVKAIGGTGATTTMYTITGRDFGKIYEITPVWFSPHATFEIVTAAVAHRVFEGLDKMQGAPPDAVKAFLQDFLEELSNEAGVNWNPPGGMPAITNNSFRQSVKFAVDNYQDVPSRKQFNANGLQPNGTLWQLAVQASDPLFTEVYADLLPDADPFSPRLAAGEPLDLGEALMTVVVRDKPFPTSEQTELIADWLTIPIAEVPRQQIISSDLGRSGFERFNTFFAAPLLNQEAAAGNGVALIAPLIDTTEIRRHGMRRFDVQSQMHPSLDLLDRSDRWTSLIEEQRNIIRDWYALNPYLLSGTLTLGVGRPDIRIGTRIQIPGFEDNESDFETYYVEQVSHNWAYGKGTQTTLGVTRGWIGTDDSYQDKLEELASKYTVPVRRKDTPS